MLIIEMITQKYEVLLWELKKTSNKLIYIGKQIDIDEKTFAANLAELRDAAKENDEKIALEALHKMVPTFTTPEEFNKTVLVGV